MKCPLFIIGTWYPNLLIGTETGDCIKELCTWYDEAAQECSVLSLSQLMTAIGNTIGRLVEVLRRDRLIYRCHNCNTQLDIGPLEDDVEPHGWTRQEQLDGKRVWICDRCSEEV